MQLGFLQSLHERPVWATEWRLRQLGPAGMCQSPHLSACHAEASKRRQSRAQRSLLCSTGFGSHQRCKVTGLQTLNQCKADLLVQPDSEPCACSVEAPQPGWQWQDSDDALKAYTALIGTLALGSIPGFRNLHHIELPYFITLASATIYIGAHRSRFVAFVEKWQGLLVF